MNNATKSVAPGVKPYVRISTERRGETVRFWVADNGIDIAGQHLTRIFETFQRLDAEYEGTGIDLNIARRAVERMGGKASVESEPGRGSRFWLDLKPANNTERDL